MKYTPGGDSHTVCFGHGAATPTPSEDPAPLQSLFLLLPEASLSYFLCSESIQYCRSRAFKLHAHIPTAGNMEVMPGVKRERKKRKCTSSRSNFQHNVSALEPSLLHYRLHDQRIFQNMLPFALLKLNPLEPLRCWPPFSLCLAACHRSLVPPLFYTLHSPNTFILHKYLSPNIWQAILQSQIQNLITASTLGNFGC